MLSSERRRDDLIALREQMKVPEPDSNKVFIISPKETRQQEACHDFKSPASDSFIPLKKIKIILKPPEVGEDI